MTAQLSSAPSSAANNDEDPEVRSGPGWTGQPGSPETKTRKMNDQHAPPRPRIWGRRSEHFGGVLQSAPKDEEALFRAMHQSLGQIGQDLSDAVERGAWSVGSDEAMTHHKHRLRDRVSDLSVKFCKTNHGVETHPCRNQG